MIISVGAATEDEMKMFHQLFRGLITPQFEPPDKQAKPPLMPGGILVTEFSIKPDEWSTAIARCELKMVRRKE